MMIFNMLRELDVLLGHAIGETAHRWGLPVPEAEMPAAARLATLAPKYQAEPAEAALLARLDKRRLGMARQARAASTAGNGVRVSDGLAALATDIYAQIAGKLGSSASRSALPSR